MEREHNMVWPEGSLFKNTDFVWAAERTLKQKAGWMTGGSSDVYRRWR